MFPISTALRESLKHGYTAVTFRHDLLAALITALVALPLSMALAIAVGLPPQHGIYTAIVAGMAAPLLGGSRMQVSGPTAAFVVIVAPMVAEFGLRGLIIAQVLAGFMIVLLALGRFGRLISFVPYPVTTGFTAGIAVVIGTLALNDLLGLDVQSTATSFPDKAWQLLSNIPGLNIHEASVGLLSLLVMLRAGKFVRMIPASILGVAAGIVVSQVLAQIGSPVATLGTRFEEIAHGLSLPSFEILGFSNDPLFAWPTYQELSWLFMPAVIIAALASLESLLSATVADGMSHTRHDPNAELMAIGLANIFSASASGIPATGAIARTTTLIKSGARTPIASALHGAFILLFIWLLSGWIAYIPMAALAALLVLTAYNMSHYKQFLRILRFAPKQDILVLLTCFGLTVFIDMVAGVTVGIIMAALLFIQRIAATAEVHVHSATHAPGSRIIPANVLIYEISGPMFFATVERVLDRTAFLRRAIDTVILDLSHVLMVDITGLVAIKSILLGDVLKGKNIYICGQGEVIAMLKAKLEDAEATHVVFADTVEEALAAIGKAA